MIMKNLERIKGGFPVRQEVVKLVFNRGYSIGERIGDELSVIVDSTVHYFFVKIEELWKRL